MTERPLPTEDRTVSDVAYFMIRVERAVGKQGRTLAGTIERLGTGEKQPFHDGRELVRLVVGWSGGLPESPG